MNDTIIDNQELALKEKIKVFFTRTIRKTKTDICPVKDMLAGSLDKWSLFVLYNLGYHQVMRFNQLKHRIEGISSRMLSLTLKKLEKNGLVAREVYAEVPPRVEYQLTEFGRGFSERVIDLSQWYLENYHESGYCDCMEGGE